MKTSAFKKWIKSLNNLDTRQTRILQEKLTEIAFKKQVAGYLETPYTNIICPHCHSKQILRWGKRNDLQRYRCKKCKRTFNSLTKTPLARLHRKGHWLDYAKCLAEGLSVRKAAAICDIHRNTAFRWRHRFLENNTQVKPQELQGIVEANEMYFRKSEKGNKRLNRFPRKRGNQHNSVKSNREFVCVFTSRDRNRNTTDCMLEELNTGNISKSLKTVLSKDVLFCSYNKNIYRRFTHENQIRHGTLDITKGQEYKKDIVHLQHVKAYQSHLKYWIVAHFRGVATKYLDNYLAWHRTLDEFEEDLNPRTILLRAKSASNYKHLPYSVT
jgi:transposase-like protein